MAASLDGFVARKDGSVDWLETSDEFADGRTMDPEFVNEFLKSIDCYVMDSGEGSGPGEEIEEALEGISPQIEAT
jgi:hypothetical protein